MKTIIINTGGTMDSSPYPDPFNPPKYSSPLEQSLVPELLEKLGFKNEVIYLEFNKQDSSKYIQKDIVELSRFIDETDCDNIIIIHGTDKMADNARALEDTLNIFSVSKTIVFTGSYTPLSNGILENDGHKNLSNAINFLKDNFCQNKTNNQKSKVYISIDDKIFEDLENLQKFKNSKDDSDKTKLPFRFDYI